MSLSFYCDHVKVNSNLRELMKRDKKKKSSDAEKEKSFDLYQQINNRLRLSSEGDGQTDLTK